MDQLIKGILNRVDVRIPLKHIQGNQYLVGDKKQTLKKHSNGTVQINVGGGYRNLDEYLENCQGPIER